MKREIQGKYETTTTCGERVRAFVPALLPPDPPIEWTAGLRSKFDEALLALGRLDSVSLLPRSAQDARRIPYHSKLDRRDAARQCRFRPAATQPRDILHGRAGVFYPRPTRRHPFAA